MDARPIVVTVYTPCVSSRCSVAYKISKVLQRARLCELWFVELHTEISANIESRIDLAQLRDRYVR
jgi:hypothetical protein